jgi:hypothetical protein
MWAGVPEQGDIAISRENIPGTTPISETKLFMFRLEDTETLDILRSAYPQGILSVYQSARGANFNFCLFYVPALNSTSVIP